MEENFSDNIKDVIGFSRDEALRLSNNSIGTEHFILGIIRLKNAGAVDILSALGIKLENLRKDVEMFATSKTNKNINTTKNQMPLKKEAEKALRTTFLEARVFNSSIVGTTHLLLCILRNDEDSTTKFLNNYNITYERVKEAFINQIENQEEINTQQDNKIKSSISEEDDMPESKKEQKRGIGDSIKHKTKSSTPVLDNFGRDLTEYAEEGKLDPVIGRAKEIERVSQILSRRKKNNPLLIGEPGVGKSAIAEGLAIRIIQKKVKLF